jgi:hypothetical protein
MARGAVSMSAHSNHTRKPLLLTAQDCSLTLLEKGGAGGFGSCWNNPGRSLHSASSGPAAFPKGGCGRNDLSPCLNSGWKGSEEPDGCPVRDGASGSYAETI